LPAPTGSRGKKRGYIVDYIGLANHLTEALTIYAASDELQELQRRPAKHQHRAAGAGGALPAPAAAL
jgi:type I site-specific restriction-modification system R (restriction) subunit